ncbi:type II toxin-antitoxin system prevent-host-death family antitoxin [Raoultibacter phocaeensis]|uniref:type II toxin-antitoxin system prevent-host-death family antitoxin n=1 Tax=Raoultibacter phocaeensis TaxID=2479841 RepID=UPI00111A55B1|nr:type II toxin-antitoxin system prevent-host-death family antitoxin [Raoultibacter phocaeensis]
MPTCIPIKDIRDTAAFAELVETSPGPVIVTKNGYDQFVVIRSSDYDEIRELQAKNRIMERMLVAERERAAGSHTSAEDSIASLRAHYGI